MPFDYLAWVVLPDHFHIIMDPKDEDLSDLLQRIKLGFVARYRRATGMYRGRVWQSRFWDHVIRNEDDMNRHIDYIHYNPVKHGLVREPGAWRFSSFEDFVKDGSYDSGWGVSEQIAFDGSHGE